ncbi:Regulatory protein AsnC [Porphyromonas macacae]|uniref:Regulatory protein AsnC n=2 Tax=Porphyromonas macacae TaxID=28115 RepID=A0A379DFX3_9PORP|nr:Regulatory protein AsnC [Porphyromonas macacae]SUB88375.1 Regulatory protein AsnC [Porphyromonas macacae]
MKMDKLDKLDLKILKIISTNARIPFKEVADLCGVSRAAIHQHVQRMIELGVITGSGFSVNPKALGFNTCTYIGVRLERGSLYKEVAPLLRQIPEIVECHYTTGPYSIFVKLYAEDNNDLMRILNGIIQEIPGVTGTETLISLDESFMRSLYIPIPDED